MMTETPGLGENSPYPIDPKEWEWETVEHLAETGYEENTYLEYKWQLRPPNGKDKSEWKDELEREFTAFANAHGGFVVFGVDDGAEPYNVRGIEPAADLDIQVSELVRNTSPTVQTETSDPIPIPGSDRVVYVAKALEANRKPVSTGDSAYYVRINSQKQPMNRDHLQSLFVDRDRRQQNVRQLEFEIERFIEVYEEHFEDGNYDRVPPEFHRLNLESLREALRANSHLYSEEQTKSAIDEVFEYLSQLEGHELHYHRILDGHEEMYYDSLDDMNKKLSKALDKDVRRTATRLERLADEAGLDIE